MDGGIHAHLERHMSMAGLPLHPAGGLRAGFVRFPFR